MNIKCKHCGAELSVPDAADGTIVRCSHCNGLVVSGMIKSTIGVCLCTVGLVLGIVNAIAGSHAMVQRQREQEARERGEEARESLEQLLWSFE